jgi:DNA-binding transcriptional ArsR family regulator
MREKAMRDLIAVMKALADESRLKIIWALHGRELCVCQIVELLGSATSTVSKHMSILKQARLVDSRKDGRWTYFRLADEDVPDDARRATELVVESLSGSPKMRDDAKRLRQILKVDREELCKQQHACRS